jgi:anti-anti-sigma factor
VSDPRLFFSLRNSDGYSVIAFPSELATAHMSDVRDAGDKIVNELTASKCPACLVDLTALNYMGSALVASVVRIWKTVKSQDGRMVVVVANPQVKEVLRVANLTKVWTIASTFEAGVHQLGYSIEAKTERRQGQVTNFIGPPLMLAALLGACTYFVPALAAIYRPNPVVVYIVSVLGFIAGLISLMREKRSQMVRRLSIAVMLLSVAALVMGAVGANRSKPAPAKSADAKAPAAAAPAGDDKTPEPAAASGEPAPAAAPSPAAPAAPAAPAETAEPSAPPAAEK